MRDYLSEYGLELNPAGAVRVADPDKAANCYLYRNNMLIGAVGLFQADRALARQRLAEIDYCYIINRRNYLDDEAAAFLAKICGAEIPANTKFTYKNFTTEKMRLLSDVGLREYYRVYESYGEPCDTYSSGEVEIEVSEYDGEKIEFHQIKPVSPNPWENVLDEPPAKLVMLATLRMFELEDITDYRLPSQRHKGFPDWDAGEALALIADAGYFPTWGRIVATHPLRGGI